MPRYQVLMNGRNFFIDMDGKRERHGFYTTRWVKAADEAAAELAAVDELRKDERLRKSVRNAPEDPPPVLYAKKITELTDKQWKRRGKSGFMWYPGAEDEESDE